MPIEFRCTHCQKLLRTPDDTAGKRAKCPECGAVVDIPDPLGRPAPPPAPGMPLGGGAPGGAAAGAWPTANAGSGASSGLPQAGAGGGLGGGQSPPMDPPPGMPSASPFSGAPPQGAQGEPFSSNLPAAASGGFNPYQSPQTEKMMPERPPFMAASSRITPTKIEVGDVFSTTWRIFKQQWGMTLAIVVVALLINLAVVYVIPQVLGLAIARDNQQMARAIAGLFQFAANIFSIWLYLGVASAMLKLVRGQPASLGDMFSGGQWFLNAIAAYLLLGLAIVGVLIVCAVPGLVSLSALERTAAIMVFVGGGVVAVVVCVVIFLTVFPLRLVLVDQNAGPIEALKTSARLTYRNRLEIFGILILMMLLWIVALIPCGLGLLILIPYMNLLFPVMYLRMSGQRTMADGYAQYGNYPSAGADAAGRDDASGMAAGGPLGRYAEGAPLNPPGATGDPGHEGGNPFAS